MSRIATISILFVLILGFSPIDQNVSVIRPAVGEQAPDIMMANPEGEIISLSSLRGKIVLIDFWASWCRTCRIENNMVRRAYTSYKNKSFQGGEGFEVYSVSLDEEKSIWKKAIHNDRLDWKSHVSDFKKWKSPVIDLYNFRSLPHNLLIDGDGKILAKGLYGDQLEKMLASLLAE